ncbi:MAG: hypothetical protein R8L58_00400, partial [Mariprofundaceae bacterium]
MHFEHISDAEFHARVQMVSVVYSVLSVSCVARLRELEPDFRRAYSMAAEHGLDTFCALLKAIDDTFAVINYHGYEVQGSAEPDRRRRRAYHHHEMMPLQGLPTFPHNRCSDQDFIQFLESFDPAMDFQDFEGPGGQAELGCLFERMAAGSGDTAPVIGKVNQRPFLSR